MQILGLFARHLKLSYHLRSELVEGSKVVVIYVYPWFHSTYKQWPWHRRCLRVLKFLCSTNSNSPKLAFAGACWLLLIWQMCVMCGCSGQHVAQCTLDGGPSPADETWDGVVLPSGWDGGDLLPALPAPHARGHSGMAAKVTHSLTSLEESSLCWLGCFHYFSSNQVISTKSVVPSSFNCLLYKVDRKIVNSKKVVSWKSDLFSQPIILTSVSTSLYFSRA